MFLQTLVSTSAHGVLTEKDVMIFQVLTAASVKMSGLGSRAMYYGRGLPTFQRCLLYIL
jgi:hypothetical protein